MNCREIEDMLSAYIDGELAAAEALAVTKHLSMCNICRQELVELQEVINSIRNLPELDPPADFHAKLCARLSSFKGRRPWYKQMGSRQWFPLGAVAAAILLFVVSFNVLSPFTSMPNSGMVLQSAAGTQAADEADKQNKSELHPPGGQEREVFDSAVPDGSPSAENTSKEEPKVEEQEEVKVAVKKTKLREPGDEREQTSLVTASVAPAREESAKIMAKDFVPGTTIQQQNNAVHAPAENKNLNNRNGSFRERQETAKQAPAPEFKTAEVGAADSLVVTWNVQLQVQDTAWVKSELKKLVYSQGGFLLNTGPNSISLSLPQARLAETLELLKKYGYPLSIENNSRNISELVADFRSKEEDLSQKIKLLENEQRMPDQQTETKSEEELKNLRQELNYIQSTLKELLGGNVVLKIYLQN